MNMLSSTILSPATSQPVLLLLLWVLWVLLLVDGHDILLLWVLLLLDWQDLLLLCC
jgi:hypothetical protein